MQPVLSQPSSRSFWKRHGSHSDAHPHGSELIKSRRKRVIVSLFLELPCIHSYSIFTGEFQINFPLLTVQVKGRTQDTTALQFSSLLKGFHQSQPRLWTREAQRQNNFQMPTCQHSCSPFPYVKLVDHKGLFHLSSVPWKGKMCIVGRIRNLLLIYSLSSTLHFFSFEFCLRIVKASVFILIYFGKSNHFSFSYILRPFSSGFS